MARKAIPYGWGEAQVRAVLAVAFREHARGIGRPTLKPPATLKWHTTSRLAPWYSGGHVWLRRDFPKVDHALGFAEGLARPGKLRDDTAANLRAHFRRAKEEGEPEHFSKPAPKPKRPKPEPTQAARLVKAEAESLRWAEALKTATRAAKLARRKLRSAKATVRALQREIAKAPSRTLPPEAFAAMLRAKRASGALETAQ